MHPTTLARQLVPAALPVFIDQQDRAALMHLARQAAMPTLPTLLHQYGHHAVAKHIFEGAQHIWGFDFGSFSYTKCMRRTVCLVLSP